MIEQQISCPMCGSKARLEEYENEVNAGRSGTKIKFRMISYACGACTNSFTTTESDTIVIDRINSKIRSEERKYKIRKYVP
jgi:hypothetical protein